MAGSVDGEPATGSTFALMGSAFVVTGIAQGLGETVEVVIDAVGQAGKASVKVAKSSFDKLGVSVGTAVQAVKVSTGTVLVASGKVLAFVPNAAGEALLHQERVPG
ncbi:putative uncharacterized protein (plasmid) [Caballeronia insecticola]|uniref:Uncharacterized protein n=1 Tax=Caballeronia insecticola TaxID=758793 RepID=R4WZ90_9BURK|nr:putative uncharacterized protein [Caballeronia insecticola]